MQGFLLTQNQYKTLGNHLKNKSYIMNIFAFWSCRQVAANFQKCRLIQELFLELMDQKNIFAKRFLEAPGIDPGTSRMLSERSTIWATPPLMMSIPPFW